MRRCACLVPFAAVAVTVAPSCRQAEEPEEEPLLLLGESDDWLAGLPPPEGPVADNGRCHVCHMNFEAEKLSVLHARADIGCEDCHGASDAHCGDEDNITPPDTMYPREAINAFCRDCHGELGEDPHKAHLADLSSKKTTCTAKGCHGSHRMAVRTRRWDRRTGKLIQDDEVRMMREERLRGK